MSNYHLNSYRKNIWQKLAPLRDKNTQQMKNRKNSPHLIKSICEKTHSWHTQWLKDPYSAPKERNKTRLPTPFIQYCIRSTGQSGKEKKGIQIEKEKGKLSLFVDDVLLYIQNSKEHKVLELMNELNKVAIYKLNIQKSFVFLYTGNEQSENELRRQFHL